MGFTHDDNTGSPSDLEIVIARLFLGYLGSAGGLVVDGCVFFDARCDRVVVNCLVVSVVVVSAGVKLERVRENQHHSKTHDKSLSGGVRVVISTLITSPI